MSKKRKPRLVYRPGHELEDINSDYRGNGTYIVQNRRGQKQKPRNEAFYRAMEEKKRSSATAPVPSGKQYKRPKAGSRNREW